MEKMIEKVQAASGHVTDLLQDMTSMPQKNTFIHFNVHSVEQQQAEREHAQFGSAPAALLQKSFQTKGEGRAQMEALHARGECKPCAYFATKADSCRLGDKCSFCHLCTEEDIKRWKREKNRAQQAARRSQKAAPTAVGAKVVEPTSRGMAPPLPTGTHQVPPTHSSPPHVPQGHSNMHHMQPAQPAMSSSSYDRRGAPAQQMPMAHPQCHGPPGSAQPHAAPRQPQPYMQSSPPHQSQAAAGAGPPYYFNHAPCMGQAPMASR
mmetsp:Transcript_23454/g.54677  ORF Transcript_23454/g.54677 Transcript_23454/m.54677 type:complete len:264 (+) Transcript_23454:117-908(+)